MPPSKHSEVTPNSISLPKGNMPMKRNDVLLNECKRIVSLKWQMQYSFLELARLWLEQKGGRKVKKHTGTANWAPTWYRPRC